MCSQVVPPWFSAGKDAPPREQTTPELGMGGPGSPAGDPTTAGDFEMAVIQIPKAIHAQVFAIGAQSICRAAPYLVPMHLAKFRRSAAQLAFFGGAFLLLSTSAYSFDGAAAGTFAAASPGSDGGGSFVELWFGLMLALLGAAQWLDHKEIEAGRREQGAAHDQVEHRPSGL